MKVMEINEPGLWVDLKVKVAQLWETNSDAISQSGLVGDETGIIKFVSGLRRICRIWRMAKATFSKTW